MRLDLLRTDAHALIMVVATKGDEAPWPVCYQLSQSVPSSYQRTLADLLPDRTADTLLSWLGHGRCLSDRGTSTWCPKTHTKKTAEDGWKVTRR